MPQINVMFSSRPKLLSEVIRNLIERQPDMKVTGEVVDPIELIFALRTTPADVVIITPHKANGDPRICSQLLKEHPQLTILMLTEESKAVYIFQSGLHRKRIERPTQEAIISAIRKSML
ncbi:MAG TPA: response regulator transcription factor [bacterium]|nr:response regulator transcription factor [bacterium]